MNGYLKHPWFGKKVRKHCGFLGFRPVLVSALYSSFLASLVLTLIVLFSIILVYLF